MTAAVEYWEARARALARGLEADERVLVVGDQFSSPLNPSDGITDAYPDRVLATPISETAVYGLAVGAAIAGFRPFVAANTGSFTFYGWPQIVNEAANVRYLSGGRVSAPVVVHMLAGIRGGGGVQHEHTPHAMLQNVPGLKIYAPSTPADVDGLIAAALAGSDPVVIVDHVLLAHVRGDVPTTPDLQTPRADLLRGGDDVLIVSYSLMTQRAIEASARLAETGIRAAVLNLRTIVPLPLEDVFRACEGRPAVVFVDESRAAGSPGTLVLTRIAEEFPDVRVRLVTTADAPSPYAPHLSDRVTPTAAAIATETERVVVGTAVRG